MKYRLTFIDAPALDDPRRRTLVEAVASSTDEEARTVEARLAEPLPWLLDVASRADADRVRDAVLGAFSLKLSITPSASSRASDVEALLRRLSMLAGERDSERDARGGTGPRPQFKVRQDDDDGSDDVLARPGRAGLGSIPGARPPSGPLGRGRLGSGPIPGERPPSGPIPGGRPGSGPLPGGPSLGERLAVSAPSDSLVPRLPRTPAFWATVLGLLVGAGGVAYLLSGGSATARLDAGSEAAALAAARGRLQELCDATRGHMSSLDYDPVSDQEKPAAPLVPGNPAPAAAGCAGGDPDIPSDPRAFAVAPWKTLGFAVREAQPFRYSLTVRTIAGSPVYRFQAEGDLDCDGTPTALTLTVSRRSGGAVVCEGI